MVGKIIIMPEDKHILLFGIETYSSGLYVGFFYYFFFAIFVCLVFCFNITYSSLSLVLMYVCSNW